MYLSQATQMGRWFKRPHMDNYYGKDGRDMWIRADVGYNVDMSLEDLMADDWEVKIEKHPHISSELKKAWQPIDSAPKDGTPILAYNGKSITVVFWHYGLEHWYLLEAGDYSEDSRFYNATHWMALPILPDGSTHAKII